VSRRRAARGRGARANGRAADPLADLAGRLAGAGDRARLATPIFAVAGQAFQSWTHQFLADPGNLARAQQHLWTDYWRLSQHLAGRLLGAGAAPVSAPAKGDRRFHAREWDESPIFDFIKQFYLLTASWLLATVRSVDGIDERSRQLVDFYTRLLIDAMAPTNFALTNPVVLKTTIEQSGRNLVEGLRNLSRDLARGEGTLAITHTAPDAFALGTDLAATPGKVVFRNELIELIQYAPAGAKAFRRPLVIVPPPINKYYILDLRPANSMVRWLVENGHTVFVVSWVNPDRRLAAKRFEDYVLDGVIAATDAARRATGERTLNAVGYCLGGTLLACALAYLGAKGDRRIASATFFAAQVDFANPGELALFIDEAQLAALEASMAEKGFLEGRYMSEVFNLLRANDLIWAFVVNNYMLGKAPEPFDFLYWNGDATRLPAEMHRFYLRTMYQQNLLVRPGAVTVGGVPLDLGRVEVPSYIFAAREDHIAPWRSTYEMTKRFRGAKRFVLGGSGHVAGIVNPPANGRYGYWINPALPAEADAWLAGAAEQPGSWWSDWSEWLAGHGGAKVAARVPGAGGLKALGDAPGTYARVRADDEPAKRAPAPAADAPAPAGVTIKRYANRRLYDPAGSRYVSLADLAAMVRAGRDVVVRDEASGEDITNAVLAQIVLEHEAAEPQLLSDAFLREMIRGYRGAVEPTLAAYLEFSLDALSHGAATLGRGVEAYRQASPIPGLADGYLSTLAQAIGWFTPAGSAGPKRPPRA
jgi:polyhydroxyalkanoate synthase